MPVFRLRNIPWKVCCFLPLVSATCEACDYRKGASKIYQEQKCNVHNRKNKTTDKNRKPKPVCIIKSGVSKHTYELCMLTFLFVCDHITIQNSTVRCCKCMETWGLVDVCKTRISYAVWCNGCFLRQLVNHKNIGWKTGWNNVSNINDVTWIV